MGSESEKQYATAVNDPNEYDPTKPFQPFDNDTTGFVPAWAKSDKANEAMNAQSSWVEAYLRDASGAAIPPDERMSYAKDFFPRPGDSTTAVSNKERLRQQKMQNALVSSGGAGQRALAKQNSKQPPKAQQNMSLMNTANAADPNDMSDEELDKLLLGQ